MKVALPVVRGLHGSRTEGTTRRFKVGDFKTEFNGLGVLRTDIRTVPGRRRGDRIGERMSASVQVFGRRDDETLPALRRPASEKRQGTKSRWVTGRGCRGRYGDFAASLGLLRLERCGRCARFSSKGPGLRGWKSVERA